MAKGGEQRIENVEKGGGNCKEKYYLETGENAEQGIENNGKSGENGRQGVENAEKGGRTDTEELYSEKCAVPGICVAGARAATMEMAPRPRAASAHGHAVAASAATDSTTRAATRRHGRRVARHMFCCCLQARSLFLDIFAELPHQSYERSERCLALHVEVIERFCDCILGHRHG